MAIIGYRVDEDESYPYAIKIGGTSARHEPLLESGTRPLRPHF